MKTDSSIPGQDLGILAIYRVNIKVVFGAIAMKKGLPYLPKSGNIGRNDESPWR
jgi:hypothetical protein